jgi:NMD protein affecting ribosome stability and mRNA decay
MTLQNIFQSNLTHERHDRLLHERQHDPYHTRLKLKEPSICKQCGAVFHHGRWTWERAPAEAMSVLCPACARIRDEIPAAYLTLRGDYVAAHRDELLHLAYHHEQRERAEHPLKRIIAEEQLDDGIRLAFSEAHLARDIGEALHKAYKGELDYHYTDEDIMLRVNWRRDD